MFLTLIFQYLNKLGEGKVGYLPPPKPLHTIKIQRLGNDCIKTPAQIGCKFPMPIAPLIRNLAIESCELTDTPPPVTRAFDFSRKAFVETSQSCQSLFQKLWRLYLFAIAQGQKCIFHTEVCTNAFTCRLQRFGIRRVRCDAKPIVTTCVAFQGNPSDFTFPIAMLEKGIRHAVRFPFSVNVFSERQNDTRGYGFCDFPTRGPWKSYRLEFVSRLGMRSTTQFLEKALIGCVNTFQFFLDRLRRQGIPVRMRGLFACRQMFSHCVIVRIRQPITVTLILPIVEILMHLPHIIYQVTETYQVRLTTQFVFIGSQDFTSTSRYPLQRGRQARYQAVTRCMLANWYGNYTTIQCKSRIYF